MVYKTQKRKKFSDLQIHSRGGCTQSKRKAEKGGLVDLWLRGEGKRPTKTEEKGFKIQLKKAFGTH